METTISRIFVADDLEINSWADVKPYFDQLLEAEYSTLEEYKQWLKKNSELEAVLEENLAWRYIKMTCDTTDKEAAESYSTFIQEINPHISEASNKINQKINSSPFNDQLTDQAHQIFLKKVSTAIKLFRQENIPLNSEAQTLAQEYSGIIGAQTITYKGEEYTAQQTAKFLKDPDREIRKEVFELLYQRREEDIEKLEDIFDKLVKVRHKIALNAGFDNFRDYKFEAMNRFDYDVQDCLDFHAAIEKNIVPIYKEIQKKKLDKFGFDKFKPYDLSADPEGKAPLTPFKGGEELLDKTVEVFEKLDPYFADCLKTMDKLGHLDLESKVGKAPGGYNYPLYEIGIPFIFMNAAGTPRDVITMIHEGGHAVHSFLTRDLELTAFKSFPSEVAELASMSMELLTMDHWGTYYAHEADLKWAKKEHLEDIIMVLPWVATIDAYQHWIYENPNHTREERKAYWLSLGERFGTGLTDFSGYENQKAYGWHKQLHLFEVPFYYIEYGFSQLGALGVWKNSIENKKKAIEEYKAGLALGYTQDIKSIYKEAGVSFDFSEENISKLATELVGYLEKL
ncbi:MAG: M3 family oligoendopeptidase [Crocinitomicaceae bacterium]|nr:M3 family oligoendopeptidase [Crocinitomicaceae bacterium]